MFLLLLALQAPVPPTPFRVTADIDRRDSSSMTFVWGTSPGAVSYNFRLVPGVFVQPPNGVDVNASLIWEQRPGTTFTVTRPWPGPTNVTPVVRACNAASVCSAFTFTTPFDFPQAPPIVAAPSWSSDVYATVTLRNGSIIVARRDSAEVKHELWIRIGTTTTPYRGFQYYFQGEMDVALTAANLRTFAANLEAGAWSKDTFDTGPIPSSPAGFGTRQGKCNSVVGCWARFTNPPLTGSWTTAPKIPPSVLRGIARALEAAQQRRKTPNPLDSLPYTATFP